ncbi:MAG: magnesium transporter [Bacteroidetes bacterium]|nr:magnesium transporter [Bacteroidota bacterium]
MEKIKENENPGSEDIQEFLRTGNTEALLEAFQEMPTIEVADILSELEEEDIIRYLALFEYEDQGRIYTDFDFDLQLELFELIDRKTFARIFINMPSELRADLYQELDIEQQLELLPFLDKKTRENVVQLSSYHPETAGGIMSTDFATVTSSMTVEQAIEKVRRDAPSKKMVYYIYVVDEQMKMQGFVTLKDLILESPETPVEDIVHTGYTFAEVNEDRENVARKVEKYDLVAIPVLNTLGQLVGIVRHDEVLEVIRAEHTEDFEKFMGIVPDAEGIPYLETTAFQHFRKRIVWIASLAAVGVISGIIVHSYESALEQLIILALYMPMMADTGGNAGSQSATVVVRAIALGQISVKNWFKIIFKEAQVSLLLAVCLGALAYAKVLFLSWETDIPAKYSIHMIAFVISLALCVQVVTSTVIGAGLPLLVRRLGGDPAVAASPAITTVVDITGLLIYFGLATVFFGL